MKKLYIRSVSGKVKGQGVDSAFLEHRKLMQQSQKIQVVLEPKDHWDILHIHTFDPGSYFLMRKAKRKKKKVVVSCHVMPDSLVGSLKIPRWVMPFLVRYMIHFYNKADRLVVVNPFYKETLTKAGLRKEKVSYVPNYVSGETFRPLAPDEKTHLRTKMGIKETDFLIVGAGQVQKRKGIDDFVRTALLLPKYQFVWVGGFSFGKLTDGYEQYAKIMDNPPPNLQFTGIVDRSEVARYFQAADVLFLPSYQELFPMTVLEAANCHLPLLLRNIELYQEILSEHYLFGDSSEEFAEQLRRIQEDTNLREAFQTHSRELSIIYSGVNVMKQWEELYLHDKIWYNND